MKSPALMRLSIFTLFFASGACGLIYQIVWTRMLTLVFGVSVYAISAVLSVFMLGLAAGSFVFGRVADDCRRPLRIYALLEIGIGVSALLIPPALNLLTPLFELVYDDFQGDHFKLTMFRMLLIGPLLFVPTFLMGGTLPIISRYFIRRMGSINRDLGFLYGLNTAGAMLGTFLVGFLLLHHLGMQWSIALTATMNIGIGFVALAMSRATGERPLLDEPEVTVDGGDNDARFVVGSPWMVVLLIGLSGFSSIGLQVLWNRMLMFYTHNTTYAFSAILMVYLLGLTLGSWLYSVIARYISRPVFFFALLEAGIGLWALATLPMNRVMLKVNELLLKNILWDNWYEAILLIFTQVGVMLFVGTLLMGMTFPLATRLTVANLGQLGRRLGLVYSANTIGAVIGSFVVGFFFIQWLGVRTTMFVLAAVNFAVAGILLAMEQGMQPVRRLALGAACLLAIPAAVVLIPHDVIRDIFERRLGKLVFYKETITDTIMVVDMDTRHADIGDYWRWLAFGDGRGTAGNPTVMENNFCAHVPLLMHKDPKDVAVICIGAANTIDAVRKHQRVETIDAIDLSQGVTEAAPYFSVNNQVFEPPVDPRITVLADDGRTFLVGSGKKFDIIQLEPPEMHTAGVVFLYTEDFYRICKDALKPGGLMAMWINVWRMDTRDTRACITAFHNVFPDGVVFQTPVLGHLLFIGGDAPPQIPLANIYKVLADEPELASQMHYLLLDDPARMYAHLLMNSATLKEYCEGSVSITDDRTLIDFSSPRSAHAGYGVIQHHNAASYDLFFQSAERIQEVYAEGGWANVGDLSEALDSVLPMLDFTGLDESQKEEIVARVEQVEDLRRAVGHEFRNGFVPTRVEDISFHWLGSLMSLVEDAHLLYVLKPGSSGPMAGVEVKLNNIGLRDADIEPADGPLTLMVGDSLTFGMGVPVEESFAARLDAARPERVLNAGIPGYNALQKVTYTLRHGLALNPTTVVIQLNPYDLELNRLFRTHDFYPHKRTHDGVIIDTMTMNLGMGDSLRTGYTPVEGLEYRVRKPVAKDYLKPYEDVEALQTAWARLKQTCGERGIALKLLAPPVAEEDAPRLEAVLAVLDLEGVDVLNAMALFEDSPQSTQPGPVDLRQPVPWKLQPNPAGHARIAEWLEERLASLPQ